MSFTEGVYGLHLEQSDDDEFDYSDDRSSFPSGSDNNDASRSLAPLPSIYEWYTAYTDEPRPSQPGLFLPEVKPTKKVSAADSTTSVVTPRTIGNNYSAGSSSLSSSSQRIKNYSGDEEESELTEVPLAPNATDQEKIEWKRRRNIIAAHRSHKRKMRAVYNGGNSDIYIATRSTQSGRQGSYLLTDRNDFMTFQPPALFNSYHQSPVPRDHDRHASSGSRSERGTSIRNRDDRLDPSSNRVSPHLDGLVPSSRAEGSSSLLTPGSSRQSSDSSLDLGPTLAGESPATDNREPVNEIDGLVARIGATLKEVKQYKQLLKCRGSTAQKLLDVFQCLLDMPQLDAEFRRSLLVAMQRLSRCAGLYPTCYDLRDIESVGEHPVAAGSFADIYKGRFMGQGVCLKVIRIYQTTQVDHFLKRFAQEAILWGQLSHSNLLPIYGLYRYTSRLCLVSPWMDNGDLSVYLQQNPNVSRIHLVSDVASGVAYLHANDIIHGDLKGANILVNAVGRACLADFGLSAVTDTNILHWTSHSTAASKGGSIRWQAPELFDVENDEVVPNTKASDVYAWACVCYEIFTGTVPFVELVRDSAVMLKINNGVRPSRPASSSPAWGSWGLTEVVWALMQDCWDGSPDKRPTILEIMARYNSFVHKDARPVESGIISPAHFRDSVGGRSRLPTVHELEDWLSLKDFSGAH